MDLLDLGSLHVRRHTNTSETAANRAPLTVVLLHGFGAPGDDLAALASAIQAPPGTTFLFPEALRALSEFVGPQAGDARCWWMIDFARLERAIATGEARDLTNDVPEGLADANAAVNEMLDDVAKVSPPNARIILGGFSQGAMLSIDVALRNSKRELAGVVALSGTLLAEKEWGPLMPARKGLPIFQSHGTKDVLLPYAIAERLRDKLSDAGWPTTFERFEDGHTIPIRVLSRLGDWLRAL